MLSQVRRVPVQLVCNEDRLSEHFARNNKQKGLTKSDDTVIDEVVRVHRSVIEKVLSDLREVEDDVDSKSLENGRVANAGELEDLWALDAT